MVCDAASKVADRCRSLGGVAGAVVVVDGAVAAGGAVVAGGVVTGAAATVTVVWLTTPFSTTWRV